MRLACRHALLAVTVSCASPAASHRVPSAISLVIRGPGTAQPGTAGAVIFDASTGTRPLAAAPAHAHGGRGPAQGRQSGGHTTRYPRRPADLPDPPDPQANSSRHCLAEQRLTPSQHPRTVVPERATMPGLTTAQRELNMRRSRSPKRSSSFRRWPAKRTRKQPSRSR
jgi:hypothetical protein